MRAALSFSLAIILFAGWAWAQKSENELAAQLAVAARQDDVAAMLALVNSPEGKRDQTDRRVLSTAAAYGSVKIARAMLDAGVNVNEPSKNGFLPLLVAIGAQRHEVVRLLLERGADANLEGKCMEPKCTRHPPLPFASYLGDVDTTKLLLARGADPRWNNGTAIKHANEIANLEIWRLLRAAAKEPPEQTTSAPSTVPLGLTALEGPLPVQKVGDTGGRDRCRFAIIAEPAFRAAADLLTIELQETGAFELLERTDLERVAAEHKLVESFGAEIAPRAASALLGADAVLFIRAREAAGTSAVEARLVRVSPGLVLDSVHAPVPLADAAEWARLLAPRLVARAGRATQASAVALSLLNVRAAQGRVADRALESQLTTLLADRLAHQPSSVLLERTAFEQLAVEPGADAFWSGKFFVDGAVELPVAGKGDITLRLRLLPSDGGEPQVVESRGSAENPARLVDAAVAKLSAALGSVQAPARRDLAAEANQYVQEASWATACGMPLLAARAADTAWALGNRTPELTRLRMKIASEAVLKEAARIAVAVRDANPVPLGAPSPVRDLLRHEDRPADAFTAAEFIELATRGVDGWRDAPPDDPGWLAAGFRAIRAMQVTLMLFDTAEVLDRHDSALDDVRARLRSSLDLAIARGAEAPEGADLLARLCELAARSMTLWTSDPQELLKFSRGLLARHFPKDDLAGRVRVRGGLLQGDRGHLMEHLSWDEKVGNRFSGGGQQISRPTRTPRKVFAVLGRELNDAKTLEDRAFARCAAFAAQAYGFRDPELDASAEAAVIELSKQFAGNRPLTYATLAMHSSRLASKKTVVESPPDEPSQPTEPPSVPEDRRLPLARLVWRPEHAFAEAAFGTKLDTQSLIWAEDSLWAYVQHQDGKRSTGSVLRLGLSDFRTIQRMDLPALPAATTREQDFRLIVTPERIIVLAIGNWIAVADRRKGGWHVEPGITPINMVALGEGNDVLFVGTDDQHSLGVARFDLRTHTSNLLVSTRRVPPQSPLDRTGLRPARIYFNSAGELIVTALTPDNKKATAAWLPSRPKPWRVVDRTVEQPDDVQNEYLRSAWKASGDLKTGTPEEVRQGIIQLRESSARPTRGGVSIRAEPIPHEEFDPGWVEKNPGLPLPQVWQLGPPGYVMTNSNLGGAIWYLPEAELPIPQASAPP